jgi:hypothetical protein
MPDPEFKPGHDATLDLTAADAQPDEVPAPGGEEGASDD